MLYGLKEKLSSLSRSSHQQILLDTSLADLSFKINATVQMQLTITALTLKLF